MPAIATRALSKRYGSRLGIDGLEFEVPEGSLFGFLGPNGCGKTTTIRILMGLLRASSGEARLLGFDCWSDTARLKREVGYLPGDVRLPAWMNGHEGLSLVGAIRGRDLAAPGRELAERLGLDLAVRVRKMSRGTRQKLGILLALAHRPRLLVLDEPTSALDPLVQERFRGELQALARAGHTIFLSSHSLDDVERLCDRVAILREGKLVESARLEELRRRSRRSVELRFADAAPDQVPPFLELEERDGVRWRGSLRGEVPELLRWMAGQRLEDLMIGPPDLERLFQEYYRR